MNANADKVKPDAERVTLDALEFHPDAGPGNCISCKHWDYGSQGVGACPRLQEEGLWSYDREAPETDADFGCTLYEGPNAAPGLPWVDPQEELPSRDWPKSSRTLLITDGERVDQGWYDFENKEWDWRDYNHGETTGWLDIGPLPPRDKGDGWTNISDHGLPVDSRDLVFSDGKAKAGGYYSNKHDKWMPCRGDDCSVDLSSVTHYRTNIGEIVANIPLPQLDGERKDEET